jgi:hypothetical protein
MVKRIEYVPPKDEPLTVHISNDYPQDGKGFIFVPFER